MLAGGGEGLVLTFLLKLFTGGTGALSEHHSSYLHSSMFIHPEQGAQPCAGWCWGHSSDYATSALPMCNSQSRQACP